MFQCHFCGETVPPGTKSRNVVVGKREKIYPSRNNVNRVPGRRRKNSRDDPGGKGFEIVKEVQACPSCAADKAEKAEE